MSNPFASAFPGGPSLLDELRMQRGGSITFDDVSEGDDEVSPEQYVEQALEQAIADTPPSEQGLWVELLARVRARKPSKVRLYVRCFRMSEAKECRAFEAITRDKRMLRVEQSESFQHAGKAYYWVSLHVQEELYDELTRTRSERAKRWVAPRLRAAASAIKRSPLGRAYYAAKAWLGS